MPQTSQKGRARKGRGRRILDAHFRAATLPPATSAVGPVTLPVVADAIARGITTAKGGQWSPVRVQRVEARTLMSDDLREAMLNKMSTLSASIVTLDDTADELVRSSSLMSKTLSEAMRMVAREHRVKILELQGQLAALGDRYASRFGGRP